MPELIEAYCVKCDEDTVHTLLKPAPNQVVQCMECHSIHTIAPRKEKMHTLRVVVSSEGRTSSCTINRPAMDEIRVGDEFIVETAGDDATVVRVTSIETAGKRVNRALVEEIRTLWVQNIEEVAVRVSVNMGAETKPLKYIVSGGREFVIGSTEHYKNISYVIKKIKLRRGGMVSKEGRSVPAKDIKRIFAALKDADNYRPRKRAPLEGSLIQGRVATWSLARKRPD